MTRVGCQIMHPRVTFRDPLPDRLYSSGNLGNRQESLEEESADIWEFHGALTRGIRKSTDMRISRTSGSRSLGRNIRRCQMPAPCERNSKRARRESRKLSRSRLSAKFTAFTRQLHSVCIRAALIYKTCPVHFILAGMDERTLPPRIERPDFHKLLFGVQSPDLLHLRFVLCLN